jgi:tetratricopeptide (TPR) repeat protein
MTRRARSVLRVSLLLLLGGTAAYFVCGQFVQGCADATCKRAARYLDLQQPQLADETLGWLLWFQPGHDVGLFLRGSALRRQKRYPDAIEALQQVAPDSHVAEQARLELVACLLADYRMEMVEAELRALLLEFPENLAVREQLSGLLLAQLRSDEASQLWRDVLREQAINTLPPEVLRRVLRALLGRAQFDPPTPHSSIGMLNESLKRHPGQPTVLGALGVSHWKLGDTQAAAEDFDRLTQRGDIAPDGRLQAARFFLETGQPERARAMVSTIAAPHDESPRLAAAQYWNVESLIHDAGGNEQRALESLDRAIDLVDNDKTLHARRARLLQKLGRTADAEAAYAQSHRLAQIDLQLWNLLRSMEEVPSNDEIATVAGLYADRGEPLTSEAWTRLLNHQ